MTFVDVFVVPIGMVTLITMAGLLTDIFPICFMSQITVTSWFVGTTFSLCSFHL